MLTAIAVLTLAASPAWDLAFLNSHSVPSPVWSTDFLGCECEDCKCGQQDKAALPKPTYVQPAKRTGHWERFCTRSGCEFVWVDE